MEPGSDPRLLRLTLDRCLITHLGSDPAQRLSAVVAQAGGLLFNKTRAAPLESAAKLTISTLQSPRFGSIIFGKAAVGQRLSRETRRENLSASVCVNPGAPARWLESRVWFLVVREEPSKSLSWIRFSAD
jgi:hypothetical protein